MCVLQNWIILGIQIIVSRDKSHTKQNILNISLIKKLFVTFWGCWYMQKGRYRLKSLWSSCIDTNNLDVCNAFAHGEGNSITWSQNVVKIQGDLGIPTVDVLLDSFDSYLFHSFVNKFVNKLSYYFKIWGKFYKQLLCIWLH